jgi:hypothetical protein
MKPYVLTNISTEGAVKIDVKKTILDDPHRAGQEMYLPGAGGVWHFERKEIFNESWVADVEQQLGLWVTGAFVFWRQAGYQHPGAHIDTYPRNGVLESIPASFNWVLDEDPYCHMTWYEPWWNADNALECERAAQGQIPHPDADVQQADYGTMSYQETDPALLQETDRLALASDRITICRTNVPHTVWMGARDRWCVSMRIGYERAPRLWQDLIDHVGSFEHLQ